MLAQRLLARRRHAVVIIRRFIKGFMTRHDPPCQDNAEVGVVASTWHFRVSLSRTVGLNVGFEQPVISNFADFPVKMCFDVRITFFFLFDCWNYDLSRVSLRAELMIDFCVQFLQYVRREYLLRLAHQAPRTVLDKSWPACPSSLMETDALLHPLCMRMLVRKYVRSLSPDRKNQVFAISKLNCKLGFWC